MKMYTTPDQTAKLIELGFEKPKMAAPALKWVDGEPTFEPQYTIGELIEMLPKSIKVNDCDFSFTISGCSYNWLVEYNDIAFGEQASVCRTELIDALFAEIVILKEEGVM